MRITRRKWLNYAGLSLGSGMLAGMFSGCVPDRENSDVVAVWGKRGLSDGKFHKPRAIAVDPSGLVYVVDMTARIQVFDSSGKFIRAWQTPSSEQGRPTGLSVDRRGRLVVADTHYFRVLFYSNEGVLDETATIGGVHGTAPGEFGFVTDIAEDSAGNYYVSEYGVSDRIQKFSATGEFICQWGTHGENPGEFQRPQSLAIDSQRNIWVADACNHRLQVFRCEIDKVELISVYGSQGSQGGEFQYPYGLGWDNAGFLWVSEFGGHRIQRISVTGQSQLIWGEPGRELGQLSSPWGVVKHPDGDLLVVDSGNHRIQKVRLTGVGL